MALLGSAFFRDLYAVCPFENNRGLFNLNITNDKDKKPKLIFNVLVSIFAFVIFMRQEKVVRETTFFDELMIETVAPVQESLNNVRLNISDFFSHYVFNISASRENIKLKQKTKELEGKLVELVEIKKENLRIKKLYEYTLYKY